MNFLALFQNKVLIAGLFAWALAQARGLNPDSPSGLSKVTLAL